jgi:quercetin 2,3-dioxygenase
MKLSIRRASERGRADHGWLLSFHTFSFADYYDPAHMGFRALRVINEDRVQPGQGFGTHSHRDMEIISYVLEGALEHKDSMGTSSIIRPGEVQRMSAGTGVTHSEFNASRSELVHFLQIWILPAKPGGKPGYEQKAFSEAERKGKLRLVASPDGRDGSVTISQDVALYAGLLCTGETVRHELAAGRHAWVHVARGQVEIGGEHLDAGDAVAVSDARGLEISGSDSSEVLLFDLA